MRVVERMVQRMTNDRDSQRHETGRATTATTRVHSYPGKKSFPNGLTLCMKSTPADASSERMTKCFDGWWRSYSLDLPLEC